MTLKSTTILILVSVLTTAAITRYYWPRVETKVVTEEKEVVRKDVRTVTRIIQRPDGGTETVTETVDRTKERRLISVEAVTYAEPQWRVGLLIVKDFGARKSTATLPGREWPMFGLEVQRRVLGPVYVGGQFAATQIGLSVGLEF